MAAGRDLHEIEEHLGLPSGGIYRRMYDMRERLGCETNMHIVGMAYDLEWIPSQVERERLDRMAGGPIAWQGHIVLDDVAAAA
jgi:hypothetical protein